MHDPSFQAKIIGDAIGAILDVNAYVTGIDMQYSLDSGGLVGYEMTMRVRVYEKPQPPYNGEV